MAEDGDGAIAEQSLRLAMLEERILELEQEGKESLALMKDQLCQLSEGLRAESTEREIAEDRRAKELKVVESTVTLDLNLERMNRKEGEMRLLKSLDDRCIQFSMEMSSAKSVAGSKDYAQDFAHVFNELEQESARRQEQEGAILTQVEVERRSIMELLATERKIREDSTKMMHHLIDNIRARFTDELQKEQKARQNTEKTLTRLIEEISKRVADKQRIGPART